MTQSGGLSIVKSMGRSSKTVGGQVALCRLALNKGVTGKLRDTANADGDPAADGNSPEQLVAAMWRA